jgi:hypothetical protein
MGLPMGALPEMLAAAELRPPYALFSIPTPLLLIALRSDWFGALLAGSALIPKLGLAD